MAAPHCPTCTCGKIKVEWSDRSCWVDPEDPIAVVECVLSCVLDHSYDRTVTGVPYGMPDKIEKILTPVIAAQMAILAPRWKEETAWLEEEQRELLKTSLLDVLREAPDGN